MRSAVFAFLLTVLLQSTHPVAPGDLPNPTLIQAVAPSYPRSRFSNPPRTVLVGLTVNPSGVPENVHIVRSGGIRFDRNALTTVAQYKFKPALQAGHPIPRDIEIEVSYKAR